MQNAVDPERKFCLAFNTACDMDGLVAVLRHGFKDLSRINLYILLVYFSDSFVRKPHRTSVRLRFLPRSRKNILRNLYS